MVERWLEMKLHSCDVASKKRRPKSIAWDLCHKGERSSVKPFSKLFRGLTTGCVKGLLYRLCKRVFLYHGSDSRGRCAAYFSNLRCSL